MRIWPAKLEEVGKGIRGFAHGGKPIDIHGGKRVRSGSDPLGEHQPKLIEAAMQCSAFVDPPIVFVQTCSIGGLDRGPRLRKER